MRGVRSLNDVGDQFAGAAHIAPFHIDLRKVADFDFSLVRRTVVGCNTIRIDVDRTIKEVCLEGARLNHHDLNAERLNFFS